MEEKYPAETQSGDFSFVLRISPEARRYLTNSGRELYIWFDDTAVTAWSGAGCDDASRACLRLVRSHSIATTRSTRA